MDKPHLPENTNHPQLPRSVCHVKVNDTDSQLVLLGVSVNLNYNYKFNGRIMVGRYYCKAKANIHLQDKQMLFEILENKDNEDLRIHARAIIVSRPLKIEYLKFSELANHGRPFGGRFNDKFYSNRKVLSK